VYVCACVCLVCVPCVCAAIPCATRGRLAVFKRLMLASVVCCVLCLYCVNACLGLSFVQWRLPVAVCAVGGHLELAHCGDIVQLVQHVRGAAVQAAALSLPQRARGAGMPSFHVHMRGTHTRMRFHACKSAGAYVLMHFPPPSRLRAYVPSRPVSFRSHHPAPQVGTDSLMVDWDACIGSPEDFFNASPIKEYWVTVRRPRRAASRARARARACSEAVLPRGHLAARAPLIR
jgi:hypothetical protein